MTLQEIIDALAKGERLYNKVLLAHVSVKDGEVFDEDTEIFHIIFREPKEWMIAIESDGMS